MYKQPNLCMPACWQMATVVTLELNTGFLCLCEVACLWVCFVWVMELCVSRKKKKECKFSFMQWQEIYSILLWVLQPLETLILSHVMVLPFSLFALAAFLHRYSQETLNQWQPASTESTVVQRRIRVCAWEMGSEHGAESKSSAHVTSHWPQRAPRHIRVSDV